MRWIWIDKFLEFRSGEFARAIKNLTLAEEHLHDHLPGYPVMPASLIIEGLAQTGGILVGEAKGFAEKVVLAKIPRAEFFGVACAGDQLDLRGHADRPAERGGRRRGQGVPRRPAAGRGRDRLRPPRPVALEPDLRARRTSSSPSSCSASSTWPRPRSGPGQLPAPAEPTAEPPADDRPAPSRAGSRRAVPTAGRVASGPGPRATRPARAGPPPVGSPTRSSRCSWSLRDAAS